MRLIALCAAALIGLLVGDLHPLDPRPLAAAALLAALVAIVHARLRWPAVLTCAVALGAARSGQVAFERPSLGALFGTTVAVHATVVDPPTLKRNSIMFTVAAANAPRIRVLADPSLASLEPGDSLTLQGRLLPPEGHSPPTLWYPRPLSPPEHATTLQTVAARVRADAAAAIAARLPEPEASLASGVLLGGARLDPGFRLQLQRSGLAHFVAIDGYKQLLLATLVSAATTRLVGAYWGRVPALLAIVAYTLITGAHPSAVRSGLMAGLATLATFSGRPADAFTSLAIAAALMAIVDPTVLLDVGLQLSVSATLGLILLWPRLRRRLWHLPRLLAEPAGLTLAVTLATLPIELAVFQSVSLVSPLAHILAVPLLPLVFGGAALVALASPLPTVATAIAALTWLPTTLLAHLIKMLGDLPGAAITTAPASTAGAAVLALAILAYGLSGLPEFRRLKLALTTSAARPGSAG